ncbi:MULTISPECIES: hypothetical protein [unclassified Sulfuricurvum]|uniref:hypothetical protein n=1 Tax=unclassified Sulfuricurvum TaxID=2632390 RepID=UPI00029985C3|nr:MULTISPECIES: hypothetical protein [unclassified Sulfuricurvum]AFV97289.1 hypothetical protein B649_04875 [Candidatus Sulfuricurvum sp. RIFRC-1]HBM34938.1 hypothetical protein [Sulfuricurvum sp.]
MVQGKPGDGLPRGEFLVIRLLLIPMVRTFFTWHIAFWLFKREARIIISLLEKLSEEERLQQVVIDKTFAIEDHSRQFSLNMVIEHLCITGRKVTSVIAALTEEREFTEIVTIAGVKPFANRSGTLDDFKAFIDEYKSFFTALPKHHSKMTKAHPWFYSFNNFDWCSFMYMHTFIHRRQIQAIIKASKESR